MDQTCCGQGQVVDSCEHVDKLSGTKKGVQSAG